MILPKETAGLICTNAEKPWAVTKILVTTKELLDTYATACSWQSQRRANIDH
jgi:hypothetical protein